MAQSNTVRIRPKYFIDERSDLHYTNINPRITIEISQTDKEGIIWCGNCYKEKAILSIGFDGIDLVNFCQDCLNLLFNEHKVGLKQK